MARTALSARLVIAEAGLLSPGVVTVEDGLIRSVGPFAEFGAPELDVLAPGFVDLQVNGVGAIDVAVAGGDEWDSLGQALLAQGVTTWCPTLVTAPEEETRCACARAVVAMRDNSPNLPEIAGLHLEGPFITCAGAHRQEHIVAEIDPGWLDRLSPAVSVVTLAPEVPGATAAITELARRGVLVSLGHSNCDAEQAHAAAAAGARLVTHLGNASGNFHQRAPGLLGAALTDNRLAVSLIADLEHVHSDLLRLAFKAKGPGGVVLVTDAVATSAGTVGPVTFAAGAAGGSAARLPDGTLAGSALTMDLAVSNVVGRAGIPIEVALEAASTTPARLLGLDDRGAIAPGRRADLVALRRAGDGTQQEPGPHLEDRYSDAFSVEAVWLAGRRVFSPGG